MFSNKLIIARLAIILVYYFFGAYGTTDILRLKYGARESVDDNEAHCPSCGHKLTLLEQIPIIAFIMHKGKCRYCHAPIPVEHEIIEVLIFAAMTVITLVVNFSWIGCLLCIFFYESLKYIYLRLYGKKDGFKVELMRSIRSNIIIFFIYIIIYSMQELATM